MDMGTRNLTSKRTSVVIFIVSFLIYSVITMTRNAFAASIAPVIAEGILPHTAAGIINAGFYLFNGIGQVAGVKIVDKASPIKLLYVPLVGTLLAMLFMTVAKSFLSMLIIWSLCGLLQFPIWPAVLRMVTEYTLPQHKGKAMKSIIFGFGAGTFLNYLLATIILKFATWRALFVASAVIVAICIVLWMFITEKGKAKLSAIKELATKEEIKEDKKSKGFLKTLISSGALLLLVPSFIRLFLDSGLKTWAPTMFVEIYGASASFGSALVTVLSFVNFGGMFFATWLCSKVTKNETTAFGICFLVSLPFAVLLLFVGGVSLAVATLSLILITTMMYASHQLMDVFIPAKFAKVGMTGGMASLMNGVASLGAVFASVGFGFMAENFGWRAAFVMQLVLVIITLASCIFARPLWEKFGKQEKV